MNCAINVPPTDLQHRWHDTLTRLGFQPEGKIYRRDGIVFRPNGGWLTLETEVGPTSSTAVFEPREQLGLWKAIHTANGSRQVFEIPADIVAAGEDEELFGSESQSLESFVHWALLSAENRVPPGWTALTQELVDSWLSADSLTLQIGGLVRQGKMILSPERWALRFPILMNVPADLPESRVAWLRQLVANAQNQWRMVRFAFEPLDGSEASTLVVETDFTGAPHSAQLFLASLDGLKHAVSWLVETAEIVADATVASRALANHPNKNTN